MKQMMRRLLFVMLGCMPIVVAAADVASARSGAGNSYLSGGDIRVDQPVPADLYAAGGTVLVSQMVGMDAALAGGKVDVAAPVGQDLRAAAGRISVNADVGGDLVIAGGNVAVGRDARIGGDALLAGGDIRVDGRTLGNAKLAGGKVVLAGEVKGDAVVYAREVHFEPGARIAGNLRYASKQPLSGQEVALVSGSVTREESAGKWDAGADGSWIHPVFFISMLVCGSILFIIFPNALSGAEQTMRRFPLRSLLLGMALLFSVPPVAVLLMVTVIGIPIGLGLMMIYPMLLLLGYLTAAFFVGHATAGMMKRSDRTSRAWQIGFLALALILLGMAASIPFLGGLLVFGGALVGMGAWAQWLYRHYRHDRHDKKIVPGAEVPL